MNSPPKKPMRTLSRRAMLILCGALVALGALALVLLNTANAPKDIFVEDTTVVIARKTLDQLESVEVSVNGDNYTCLYDGYTLTLEDAPDIALKEDVVAAMLTCCQTIIASDTVLDTAITPVELHHFGLDQPRSATITYKDGDRVTLMIGGRTPADIATHYLMVGGDTHIYTIDPGFYEAFDHMRESLRAFEQPQFNAALIDSVRLSGAVTLDMWDNGEFWEMRAPYRYPTDATRTGVLLDAIAGIKFSSYIGQADDLTLSDYGLDAPTARLEFRQVKSRVSATDESGRAVVVELPETLYTVLVGDMRDDTMYYVAYEGCVYTAGMLTTRFMTSFDVKGLLNRNPISFDERALTALTLTMGDQAFAYRVALVENVLSNNELETDENGEVVYRFRVTRNGVTIDSEAFLNWYASLVAIQAQGYVKENEDFSAVTPDFAIEIKSGAHARVARFFRYDTMHYACSVNGVMLFYMSGDFEGALSSIP